MRVGLVLLNFQRIQTEHTLLQHIVLWHPVLGMVHAVLSPSLLHFPLFFDKELSSVAQYTLFIGRCILAEKLVFLLDTALQYFSSINNFLLKQRGKTFWVIKAKLDHWIRQEWLAGWGSVFFLAVSECPVPQGSPLLACASVRVCKLEILFVSIFLIPDMFLVSWLFLKLVCTVFATCFYNKDNWKEFGRLCSLCDKSWPLRARADPRASLKNLTCQPRRGTRRMPSPSQLQFPQLRFHIQTVITLPIWSPHTDIISISDSKSKPLVWVMENHSYTPAPVAKLCMFLNTALRKHWKGF